MQVEESRGLCRSPLCPSTPWSWPTDVDDIEEGDPATLSDLFFPVPQSYMHTVSLPTFAGWFVEALTINVLVSTKVL